MEQGLESEDYRAWDKAKQEKRADNRAQSASILARAGVIFESRNDGAHLVVLAGAHVVDFWPGTGLWIVRGSQARKRGVRALLAFRTAQIQPSNAEVSGGRRPSAALPGYGAEK